MAKQRKGIVVTFINEKGGVGKTSCCFNMAWKMASDGEKILMIDMDGQKANLTFFCAVKKDPSLKTIYNVLKKKDTISDVIINIKDNLDLVPADSEASYINPEFRVRTLKEAIHSVKDEYDYIFIDVSPAPNWAQGLSTACSDYLIIPMLPDATSVEADTGIIDTIKETQQDENSALKVLGIVFMKYNTNTNLSKQVQDIAGVLAKRIDTKIFETRIRQAVVLSENVSNHIGITDYSPSSRAAEEFSNLVKEFRKEVRYHERKNSEEK